MKNKEAHVFLNTVLSFHLIFGFSLFHLKLSQKSRQRFDLDVQIIDVNNMGNLFGMDDGGTLISLFILTY